MELVPFSVINTYLKERLIHPSRYTGENFSFLKIFQHGLSFSMTKQKHKEIKTYLSWPFPMQMMIYYLKSLRGSGKKNNIALKEYVILDPGRMMKDTDGAWHSIYFDKIAQLIGQERCTIISMRNDALFRRDHSIQEFSNALPVPDDREKSVLREIIQVLRFAYHCKQFTADEMRQIKSALHVFFEEFRFYYHIFLNQPVKHMLFVCHYHNEGLIAAVKMMGIQCIEVQHGLIATNDQYYVYHEQFASVISKAMFPDKILVYGPYWKRILEIGCEYHSFQIHIAGDYLYRLSDLKITPDAKQNIVLICAQKNLHQDYVSYTRKLSEHLSLHPDWRGIVKLHPLEKNKAAYDELRQYGIEIVDIETPLDELLAKSRIQISIYSTTFYDAFGFDVVNFSLQDYGAMSDYASDMISEGVAEPLLADEDPIAKYLNMSKTEHEKLSRKEVYSDLDENIIRKAIGLE